MQSRGCARCSSRRGSSARTSTSTWRIGTHNLRSIAHALAVGQAAGAEPGELEVQVLRGLGDELAAALARLGWRVRVYTPIGDLVAGMAYLVRRLLENSSNEGFLLQQR